MRRYIIFRRRLNIDLRAIAAIILSFSFSGCQSKHTKEYRITCIVTNATPGHKLYLQKWYYDSLPIIDSATITKSNQKILFTGRLNGEKLFSLFSHLERRSRLNIIVTDTPMTIQTDFNDSDWLSSTITGSAASNVLKDYITRTIRYGREKVLINHKIDSLRQSASSEKEIQKLKKILALLHKTYTDSKYNEARNSHSPILAWWLVSTLQQDEGTDKIKPLMPALKRRFYHSSFFGKYARDYSKLIRPKLIYDSLPVKIINFTLPSYQGKSISLKNILVRNKYTLIDFWASWCAPCRAELPFLSKAHHLFKDKGFQILSISIDKNKEDWIAAIKKYNMDWPQLIINTKDSQIIREYGITSIPKNLLVNKNGEIIGRNLRNKSVINKLSSLFKKE